MAQQTKADLLISASIVRDETQTAANTATRVGGLMYDMVDSLETNYISNSVAYSLNDVQINNYKNDVFVSFDSNTGNLVLTFGTAAPPSALDILVSSGFVYDRFNNVNSTYSTTGSYTLGSYRLISASLYTGSTLLGNVGTGTSVTSSQLTTSGSQTYRLVVTSSAPDNTVTYNTYNETFTVSKSNPANPIVTPTVNVQLGLRSGKIEQGATGSITYTSASGGDNGWALQNIASSPASPVSVTGDRTGSAAITINVVANYQSPGTDNIPTLTYAATTTTTYQKQVSLRYGASSQTSFTQTQLEDLSSWDTRLGGTIGFVTTVANPSGQFVIMPVQTDMYVYFVYDDSLNNLTRLLANNSDALTNFTRTTVGNYKVYRSNSKVTATGTTRYDFTI